MRGRPRDKWGEVQPECVVHRYGPWHDKGVEFWRACQCGKVLRVKAHPAVQSRDATKHLEAILAETGLEGE